jgi:hypothetical protein
VGNEPGLQHLWHFETGARGVDSAA